MSLRAQTPSQREATGPAALAWALQPLRPARELAAGMCRSLLPREPGSGGGHSRKGIYLGHRFPPGSVKPLLGSQ